MRLKELLEINGIVKILTIEEATKGFDVIIEYVDGSVEAVINEDEILDEDIEQFASLEEFKELNSSTTEGQFDREYHIAEGLTKFATEISDTIKVIYLKKL